MPRLLRLSLLVPALLLASCNNAERDTGSHLSREAPAASEGSAAAPAADVAGQERNGLTGTPPGAAPAPAKEFSATDSAPAGDQAVIPQMIIRTGTATVRVDSLEQAMARVEQLARRLGGFVANTSVESGSESLRQATMELKIPAARWNDALSGLRPIGDLEARQTGTEDVGEEYVDVTARMTNARRLEGRLLELLATRTGKLDDVLAVERELSRVREEIERYEGRLRFLRTRAAVSTLTVRLHEPSPVLAPGHSPIVDAFRDAWRNFVGFTAGFISALGWLIPLLLVLAGLVWVLRRLLGRRSPPGWPRFDAYPGRHAPGAPPQGAPAQGPSSQSSQTPPPPQV